MTEDMLSEDAMDKSDVARLAQVLGVLVKSFENLDSIRRLSTLNLLMKVAFTRDARDLIIPPMEDLTQSQGKTDGKNSGD